MKWQIQFAKKILENEISEQLSIKLHNACLEIYCNSVYVQGNRPWKMCFQDIISQVIIFVKTLICFFQYVCLLLHLIRRVRGEVLRKGPLRVL